MSTGNALARRLDNRHPTDDSSQPRYHVDPTLPTDTRENWNPKHWFLIKINVPCSLQFRASGKDVLSTEPTKYLAIYAHVARLVICSTAEADAEVDHGHVHDESGG